MQLKLSLMMNVKPVSASLGMLLTFQWNLMNQAENYWKITCPVEKMSILVLDVILALPESIMLNIFGNIARGKIRSNGKPTGKTLHGLTNPILNTIDTSLSLPIYLLSLFNHINYS